MKIIALSFLLALSAYAYPHLPPMMPQQTVDPIMGPDGTPSPYRIVRLGNSLKILADYRYRDGSVRSVSMLDSDGDNKVDLAYVMGKEEEDERMFYQRNIGEGKKFEEAWEEDWNEAVYRIEELIGRSIRGGGQ